MMCYTAQKQRVSIVSKTGYIGIRALLLQEPKQGNLKYNARK